MSTMRRAGLTTLAGAAGAAAAYLLDPDRGRSRRAQRVDGVRQVRNLMHLPGTPAPTAV